MNKDPFIEKVQLRLLELGFDPGEADGIPGRRTKAAVASFQEQRNLPIKFPGTIGPITTGALFEGETLPKLSIGATMPWYDLCLRKKGLHESRDYNEVKKFLKSDGKTLGDPRTLPWCGDLVETCIALTLPEEALPVNPYLARNWLKFGQECEPQQGAVLIFWRGTKTGLSGHVCFDAGQGDGVYYCLGGNQSNTISVTSIAKTRLLGARWPKTIPLPGKVLQPVMAGGILSVNEA